MESIIVKVRCNGDIRRMAVEDSLNLQDLRTLLSKLYGIRKFKIYRDDLDLIPISDDTELFHILKMVRSSSTKVLRLALVEEPEEIAATPLERVIMRGDIRAKLEEVIVESVKTKPVMDAIIQKMLPQIAAAIEEDTKEDLSSIVIRNVEPSVIEETLSRSSATSCSSVSSSSSLDQSISPEEEEIIRKEEELPKEESSDEEEENEEEEEEFESRDEDEPLLDESKIEEEEEESEDKKEEIFEREIEREEKEEEVPEPVVSTEPALSESQTVSPFKAFLSLVKSIISKKDSVDMASEEMLKQLNEMGFTDRESNLRLVKFHNQFKEGLDEVVEALLTQSQLENNNNNELSVSSH